MKKQLFIALSILGIANFGFGQNQPANDPSQTTQTSSTKEHSGILFKFPAGSWIPVPVKQSLVPYMDNKVQEQIEKDKKVTVIYQTAGTYMDVPSLFDQSVSVFGLNWSRPTVVEPLRLISPITAVGGPRKFNAVYRIVEETTKTTFRVEVVAISSFDMRGNKGALYIICPDYNYYENRFMIESIRNALVLDVNAVRTNNKTTTTVS